MNWLQPTCSIHNEVQQFHNYARGCVYADEPDQLLIGLLLHVDGLTMQYSCQNKFGHFK